MTAVSSKSVGQQIAALRQMAKRYRIRSRSIAVRDSRIPIEVLKGVEELIAINYEHYLASIQDIDVQDTHKYKFFKNYEKDNGRFALYLSGPQVIYDEFGTGEEGKASADASVKGEHPDAKAKNINPYNSGPMVSMYEDAMGYHYWNYGGVLTYGVPQGRFMYDAFEEYANGLAAEKGREELIRAWNDTSSTGRSAE